MDLPSFQPASWLPGPHLQTVGARFLRPRGGVPLRRERWDTPDGDFLDLDFVAVATPDDAPLVLVLHGLEGSSHSGYAWQLYRRFATLGCAAVGLNFRSCSGQPNRAPRLYHSGETSDPAWVVARLAELFPARPLAAVGVSLGGNVLLKLLGEQSAACRLVAAAALSVPFDLAAGAEHMTRGIARAYVANLLRKLKAKLRGRAGELGARVDLARALAARTFWEFDDAATGPLHGFAGADDYYARASCNQFVAAIRVPTLVVHSLDDPFQPASAVPAAALAANPALTAVLTAAGGHVGFAAANGRLRPRFWAEEVIAAWVAARCWGRSS